MRRWNNWVPTHIKAQAFSKQIQSMALVCYLCLCSRRYTVVHVKLVDFLSQWRQPEQWRYSLQSTTLLYLAIYGCCLGSGFCTIVAMHVLDSITSSKWCGWDSVNFCACPHAIMSGLPRIYPWRHTHDKLYKALPLLSRESLRKRLKKVHLALYVPRLLPLYMTTYSMHT